MQIFRVVIYLSEGREKQLIEKQAERRVANIEAAGGIISQTSPIQPHTNLINIISVFLFVCFLDHQAHTLRASTHIDHQWESNNILHLSTLCASIVFFTQQTFFFL